MVGYAHDRFPMLFELGRIYHAERCRRHIFVSLFHPFCFYTNITRMFPNMADQYREQQKNSDEIDYEDEDHGRLVQPALEQSLQKRYEADQSDYRDKSGRNC